MEHSIFIFILVGFVAQIIDGALGMAYGVSSTTFLLSVGISPAVASASVHMAEVFTTAISGFSHFRLGNVDKRLFLRLVIPGALGGALGAYVLTTIPGSVVQPFVAVYLLVMGIIILRKALQKNQEILHTRTYHLVPLGLIGGFFDAIGGGGWGPIVTTTLMARGNSPRFTIGSVNLAEFFVTLCESVAFVLTIGLVHWHVIIGLMIGGGVAAPLAAILCRKLPARAMMIVVGLLIVALSVRTLILNFA
jgi:uncharacterized membrane protein YfcA